ncbi:TPA: Lrp/AsnC family transcriptional regulator [Thermoplasmata archaeon]|nr:Lrp/AsnC family transcriptional regulator [Thermoplasmata archaeon]
MNRRTYVALLATLMTAAAWGQEVSVYGTTMAQVWKDEVPGFNKKTFTPATQFLGIDATKLGYDLTAIIGVKVIHGHILETERDLAKDPAVYAVFDSTGDWDAIIMARFKNRVELNDYVKRALDHENVDKTYTQVVLNITKDEKRVKV